MLQATGIMLGVAMLLVLCAVIVIVLATIIIKRLASNIAESIRNKKYPLFTEKAVIADKTYTEDTNKYTITFVTESGNRITANVSSWEYSVYEKGQNVLFSYRQNIAIDIKPL